MKQNIIWEIEKIQYKKIQDASYFKLVGWALAKDKKELSYQIWIDEKEVSFQQEVLEFEDIYQIYSDYLDTNKIGFSIKVPVQEEVSSFAFHIKNNEETISYTLNAKQIADITSIGEIDYEVEEFKYDVAKKEYFVTGWALDILGEEVELTILDSQNQKIEAKKTENDIYICFYPNQRNIGFKLVFPSEEGISYRLLMKSKNDEKEVQLVSETKQSNIPTSRFAYIVKKGIRYLERNGVKKTLKRVFLRNSEIVKYNQWLEAHAPSLQELAQQRETNFAYAPKISVIVATFNTKESYLKEMIDSLVSQSYQNWELCVADGSTNDFVQDYIQEHYSKEKRIVFKRLERNYGISGNMNAALEMVSGEYVGLFDHDDLITPDCLYEIVSSLQVVRHEAIYTDEDKLDDEKQRFVEPHFKPDYSIDQLCSHNYITHFFVVSKKLVDQVGGLREEYDGSQDHDFILRCCEKANSVHHIPKILYHWRMHLASTAMNPESKMYCYTSGKKAVQAHYDRLHIRAKSEMLGAPLYGIYRSHFETPGNPLVSIVIPNRNLKDTLKTCIDSLYKVNTYKNFEIVIVENNSTEADIFDYYKELENTKDNIQIVTWKDEFNYSAINNYGVQFTHGDYLLFLNNDTEVISEEAISEMLGYCMRKDVGCVGAKLLYRDRTIQHCGVVIGYKGYAAGAFTGLKEDDFGYMAKPLINANYSAVTAACMMVKRKDFDAVQGFDPAFKVACNDVDFCLKVRSLNKVNVLNVYSLWYHDESKTRGLDTQGEAYERFQREVKLFQAKWPDILAQSDPFHSPNFNLEIAPFVLPYKRGY